MPFLFFKLSGENLELGLKEIAMLFYPKKIEVQKRFDNFALIKINCKEEDLKKVRKLAFSHFCAILIKKLKSLELKELDKINWSFVKLPFCVRVIDLTKKEFPNIEARLAGPIYDFFTHHREINTPFVSLENPKTTILFVIREKEVYVCKMFWKAESGRFKNREPSKKPAFHPTSLKPKLALLLVNLTNVKPNEILLDPFCGTGSILIEAGLIKSKPIGVDIDSKMIEGARLNLNFYKVKGKLIIENALNLPKLFRANSIDAIATDPPYGRSTKIGAPTLDKLYKDFFDAAHFVLKKNRFLALMYPHYIKAEKLIKKGKWKKIFSSEMYVHGGLTRKILVLQKK
ncbi:MAG: DNA methyltransferase [Candidatus Nanoarchaeia archaeon]